MTKAAEKAEAVQFAVVTIVEHRREAPEDCKVIALQVYRDPFGGEAVFGFVGRIETLMDGGKVIHARPDFGVSVADAFAQAVALCEQQAAPVLLIDDPAALFPRALRPSLGRD